MESLRARFLVIFFVLTLGFYWFTGTLFPDKTDKWWVGKTKLTYGLDIQGGLHLVMGVDVDGFVKEITTRLASDLEVAFKEKNISVKSVQVVNSKIGEIKIVVSSSQDLANVKKYIDDNRSTELQVVESGSESASVRFYETYLNNEKERIVKQAIEVIRNRIDEFGVSEPSITAQGKSRILVQLPGIKDAQRAKDLINRAARLNFMMLNQEVEPDKLKVMIEEAEKKGNYSLGQLKYMEYVERINSDLKTQLPEKTQILFMKADNAQTLEKGKIPVAVRTDLGMSGDSLKDAYVGRGEYGEIVVHITFNSEGAGRFAKLTEDNRGKYMAIVLDNVVKSHPVIKEKIPGGRGVITMGSDRGQEKVFDEAQLISTALRAGALPASLQQLEERTVGPTLGKDSIDKGKKAAMFGTLLVLIFMILYYKTFGVVANIALILNLALTLAVLASMGAVLTLPGIAGFALTAGMAVDANVLIFERIKDELRRGSGIQTAIREGYNRAFSAIFDGNVTTIATCIVLIYYGTGPVRGFGVSMTVGLTISMFTAVFVTRAVLDLLVGRLKFDNVKVLI